ncbi:zf-HC2 domain-containing protein [Nocardiopsis eucommiae]|uniref:Zf-HC2 domain-containing protein n=1 Tax=Nocardiopsis eucommiae TaxID=2831970 RepID=A0A975LA29_9ACTN|nr:zf-HC2 domain-containing protein [Nocardiopsis eucommiae]
MSRDSHRAVRDLLGAHALDMLGPEQRAAVSAHLDGCADCRTELDFVAPAAELLPLADPDRASEPPAPLPNWESAYWRGCAPKPRRVPAPGGPEGSWPPAPSPSSWESARGWPAATRSSPRTRSRWRA